MKKAGEIILEQVFQPGEVNSDAPMNTVMALQRADIVRLSTPLWDRIPIDTMDDQVLKRMIRRTIIYLFKHKEAIKRIVNKWVDISDNEKASEVPTTTENMNVDGST